MIIKRSIINKLVLDLSTKYSSILVGARQVGKTFLLRELAGVAKKQGKKTAYFDLEQPEDLRQFNRDEGELVSWLTSLGAIIFLDEFHYLKNASHIFKAIYDRGGSTKIFASGSSSLEIHKHLKESLAGRKLVYQIQPCSLGEIAQAVQQETLDYFCRYGGLPGLVHIDDPAKKKSLLLDILQSYLLKDIKGLIKEENIRAFNHLLYLLAQYQGSVVATANLAGEVGLTARTIESHLEIMAQTYVNFPLHSFSNNLGNELKKSKKYFLYDLGIRNALLKNFSTLSQRDDAGPLTESFVFLELQKQLSPETEIRFWRLKSGEEVDFVWIKNQQPTPIEVKTTWKKGEVPSGLKAFLRRYPKTKMAFVISRNAQGTTTENGVTFFFKTLDQVDQIPDTISQGKTAI